MNTYEQAASSEMPYELVKKRELRRLMGRLVELRRREDAMKASEKTAVGEDRIMLRNRCVSLCVMFCFVCVCVCLRVPLGEKYCGQR